MTDPVIRIVDDDPRMHDALQFILESEGYSVRHFFSAEDFLAGDFLSDPGCAVLDVRMGKMSGLVLQRVLKEREVDLPVIFLSAHGDIGMAVDAIDSGAVTFLTKPVRAEKLLTAVDKALSRKGPFPERLCRGSNDGCPGGAESLRGTLRSRARGCASRRAEAHQPTDCRTPGARRPDGGISSRRRNAQARHPQR